MQCFSCDNLCRAYHQTKNLKIKNYQSMPSVPCNVVLHTLTVIYKCALHTLSMAVNIRTYVRSIMHVCVFVCVCVCVCTHECIVCTYYTRKECLLLCDVWCNLRLNATVSLSTWHLMDQIRLNGGYWNSTVPNAAWNMCMRWRIS